MGFRLKVFRIQGSGFQGFEVHFENGQSKKLEGPTRVTYLKGESAVAYNGIDISIRSKTWAFHDVKKFLTLQCEHGLGFMSVCHVRTGRPVNEFGSLISNVRENPSRDSENQQIRILFERQKSANSR